MQMKSSKLPKQEKIHMLENKSRYYRQLGETAALYTFTKSFSKKKLQSITPQNKQLPKETHKGTEVDMGALLSPATRDISHLKDKLSVTSIIKFHDLPSDIKSMKNLLQVSDHLGNPLNKGFPISTTCRKDPCMDHLYKQSLNELPSIERLYLGGPTGRQECNNLRIWFKNMKEQYCADEIFTENSIIVHNVCVKELIRQVSVQCIERGELLQEIVDFFIQNYEKARESLNIVQKNTNKVKHAMSEDFKRKESELLGKILEIESKNKLLQDKSLRKNERIIKLQDDLKAKNESLEDMKEKFSSEEDNSLRAFRFIHKSTLLSKKSTKRSSYFQTSLSIKSKIDAQVQTDKIKVIKKKKNRGKVNVKRKFNPSLEEILSEGLDHENNPEKVSLSEEIEIINENIAIDEGSEDHSGKIIENQDEEPDRIEKSKNFIIHEESEQTDKNFTESQSFDKAHEELFEESLILAEKETQTDTNLRIYQDPNSISISVSSPTHVKFNSSLDGLPGQYNLDISEPYENLPTHQQGNEEEEIISTLELKEISEGSEKHKSQKQNTPKAFIKFPGKNKVSIARENPPSVKKQHKNQVILKSSSHTSNYDEDMSKKTEEFNSLNDKIQEKALELKKLSKLTKDSEKKIDGLNPYSVNIEGLSDQNLNESSRIYKNSTKLVNTERIILENLNITLPIPVENLEYNENIRRRYSVQSVLSPHPASTQNRISQNYSSKLFYGKESDLEQTEIEKVLNRSERENLEDSISLDELSLSSVDEKPTEIDKSEKRHSFKTGNTYTEFSEFRFHQKIAHREHLRKNPAKKILLLLLTKKENWIKKRANMSKKKVNKMISSMFLQYFSKGDFVGTLLDFTYDDFFQRYSIKAVAAKKLIEFISSVASVQGSRRCEIFLRFINAGSLKNRPNYSQETLIFYLSCLNFMINSKIGISVYDETSDKVLLPLARATELVKEKLNRIDRTLIAKSIAFIEKNSRPDPKKINSAGVIENELLLELLANIFEEHKNKIITGIETVINALKYNEDKEVITKQEFSMIFRNFCVSKLDEAENLFGDQEKINTDVLYSFCIEKFCLNITEIHSIVRLEEKDNPNAKGKIIEGVSTLLDLISEIKSSQKIMIDGNEDYWEEKLRNLLKSLENRSIYESILALHVFQTEISRIKS